MADAAPAAPGASKGTPVVFGDFGFGDWFCCIIGHCFGWTDYCCGVLCCPQYNARPLGMCGCSLDQTPEQGCGSCFFGTCFNLNYCCCNEDGCCICYKSCCLYMILPFAGIFFFCTDCCEYKTPRAAPEDIICSCDPCCSPATFGGMVGEPVLAKYDSDAVV